MKKIIFLALVALVTFFASAQNPFEGKITYSISITGDGAEAMSAFMFNSYEYYFSENNVRLTLGGGMSFMFGSFMLNDLTKKAYMIMDDERIAYEMPYEEDEVGPGNAVLPEIEKLEGTEKILGYTCSEYKVTTVEDSTTTVMHYWVTKDLSPGSKKKVGTTNSLFVDGIDGFPLKIVSEADGMVITIVATEILKQKLDKSLFEVPRGYEVKDFSESPIGAVGE